MASLRPRLLSSVGVFRQHFRGQLWYVLENTANNQYSRLSLGAYAFVGLLDGHRTVTQAWTICNEQHGDGAPTQGEVIQILGQLSASNLLYVDLPADSAALFERYRKRVTREIKSYFMNLLYIRIPLLDPDLILNAWVSLFGLVFSWIGLILWLGLVGTGLAFVIANMSELMAQSQNVLAPKNLIYLYATFVSIKICHEFSHAFACKKFGRLNRNGGQVHTMGVMFLVFFPLPYMDASSAWAFPNKWHRTVVGLAGILVELALAAVAAIVWANTSTGTIHIIAYNVIFVASVSTLIFNGNPLLRFDAYYVLSDLLEIPNLAHKSKAYVYYLVKRYIWGMKKLHRVAHTWGERLWFLFYGVASTLYRIFICIRILLFLNDRLPEQFFFLVPFFVFSAVVAWVFVPVGKFFKYLTTGAELTRQRTRALALSLIVTCALVVLLGIIKLPDHCRFEGIIEPNDLSAVYMEVDGFVTGYAHSGQVIEANEVALIQARNPNLEAQRKSLAAQHLRLKVQWRIAQTQEVAATQIMDEQIQALEEQIARVESQLASLSLKVPQSGTWFSPDIHRVNQLYVQRGQQVGRIGQFDKVIVRATASQNLAALLEKADKQVEMRLQGYARRLFTGNIIKVAPMGQDVLPSEALGYQAGGSTAVRYDDPRGPRAAEKIFEVRISLDASTTEDLMSGQRVITRVSLPAKPLLWQWYRSARQLFQRRFYI